MSQLNLIATPETVAMLTAASNTHRPAEGIFFSRREPITIVMARPYIEPAQIPLSHRIDLAATYAIEQSEKLSDLLFNYAPASHPARGQIIDAFATHGVEILRKTIRGQNEKR